jgi:Sigma-70, region 4/Putative zinc-finger
VERVALDEGKRAGRKRSMPMTDEALAAPDDGRAPDEVVGARFDDARIREILSELPKRRQMIVKLRFFFDRTPAEIQRYMGLTERAYRRELERAMRQLADGYELVRGDQFCDSRRSLILAYVAGIAGPNRAQQARAHLASCPGCNHWAAAMRDATERAAALAPLPLLAEAKAGAFSRAFEALVGARGHVLDAASGVKQHAVSIATRVDPGAAGYAATARPGAVAVAVAGCLAVGSGATYCAVQGLPSPVRSLVTHEHRHAAHQKASNPPHAKRAKAAVAQTQRPQTPAAVTVPRAAQAQPRAHASAPRAAPKQRRQSASDQEFGPAPSAAAATDGAGSAQAASASNGGSPRSASTGSSRPSSPSAVRSGPPGEFDP